MYEIIGIKEFKNKEGKIKHALHVASDKEAAGLTGRMVQVIFENKNFDATSVRVGSHVDFHWSSSNDGWFVTGMDIISY